jgi:hypothetical protein
MISPPEPLKPEERHGQLFRGLRAVLVAGAAALLLGVGLVGWDGDTSVLKRVFVHSPPPPTSQHITSAPLVTAQNPVPAAVERQRLTPGAPARTKPSCESYGTLVGFVSNPAEAVYQARAEGKMMLVLHVSGNFEDAKFT